MRLLLAALLALTPLLATAQFTSGGGRISSLDQFPDVCGANELIVRDGTDTANVCAVNASGGASTAAAYITKTAEAGLTNEFALSGLATGFLINTTGTGIPTAYGGDSCTNQFPRSQNASGVWTCATVTAADVAADVTIDTDINTTAKINAIAADANFSTLTLPETFATGLKTVTAKFDFGGGTLEVPNSITLPGSCVTGDSYQDSDATSGAQFYLCEGASWVLQGGGSGDASTNTGTSVDGEITVFNGTTGKSLRRATQTGVLTGTSGVIGLAASGDITALFSGTCDGTTFMRGDGACATPAGAGDTSTNTATSVVDEVALFADTAGKLLKRSTQTGLGLLTSGVLSAYSGDSCTNQFARSVDASGVWTCATVASTDLSASLDLTTPDINAANAASITMDNGGALRTTTTTANTVLIQAYDVDGASYTTLVTATSGNTPTLDLAAGTTVGGDALSPFTDPDVDAVVMWDDSGSNMKALTIGAGITFTAETLASSLGTSVDLASEVTGITPGANGGTGNGFTAFSGPATSLKTFTLPNATATILTDNAVVTVAQGGTGVGTLTGLLQGNGAGNITGITNSVTVGQALRVTGANTYAWGAIDLADGDAITGNLPVTSLAGGTGAGPTTFWRGDGSWATPAGGGTVTNTGNLTLNSVVLGNGTTDTKVVAGITTDGASAITVGQTGASVGGVVFENVTSGNITVNPTTGALGTSVLTLPAVTSTVAVLSNTLGDFGATTSAQLATTLSDEQGSGGGFVRATSPTLTTPVLGVATATSINGATITTTTGGTLTLATSSSLITSGANSITLTSTGPTNVTLPNAGTLITTTSTNTLTNKTINAESTGNVITIPFEKDFPAAGCNNATASPFWDLPVTNPAVAACRTGTNVQKGTLDFADGANTLTAQSFFRLPTGWTGAIDAVVTWSSTTTTGDVVWQLAIACAGDADSDDPAFTDDVFTADTTKGTANQLNDTVSNPITTTGTCAAGDIAHMRLKRDPTNGSDTMAGTARALNVQITYRAAL